MHRESLLIVLGILVLVSPFLGLPMTVLAVLLPLFGGSIFAIGVSMRARRSAEPEPHYGLEQSVV